MLVRKLVLYDIELPITTMSLLTRELAKKVSFLNLKWQILYRKTYWILISQLNSNNTSIRLNYINHDYRHQILQTNQQLSQKIISTNLIFHNKTSHQRDQNPGSEHELN